MSRPDTWFPKLTTLRKMACLDTDPPDPSYIGSGNQPEFTEAFLELALWAVDGPP